MNPVLWLNPSPDCPDVAVDLTGGIHAVMVFKKPGWFTSNWILRIVVACPPAVDIAFPTEHRARMALRKALELDARLRKFEMEESGELWKGDE